MDDQRTNAIRVSILVGCVITGMVIVLWNTLDLPPGFEDKIIALLTAMVIALVVIATYRAVRVRETAHSIAENLAESRLTYSQELFTELYRNGPVPYLVIGSTGVIETMNFAAARLFHVEHRALEGVNFFDLLTHTDEHKLALIPEYFTHGKFVNDVEIQIRRPDGVVLWVMLSLFSFTAPGRVRKGMLTLVDITKQKLVDQAKTEFVSLASHQLRTPISTIKWQVGLLAMQLAHPEKTTDSPQVVIGEMSSTLERMELLVDDFLSASRFELGTLTPEYTEVRLTEFLDHLCSEHLPLAQTKGIIVAREGEPITKPIRSDTHLLHMILSNLLGNALKYTKEGGSVTIVTQEHEQKIIVAIRDTGIGIPVNEQEMLFSKLFRASNARAEVINGTGLGLYIVREAARTLGGEVSCTSEEGKGSTFTLMLPK